MVSTKKKNETLEEREARLKYHRDWHRRNPRTPKQHARMAELAKKWRQANPEKVRAKVFKQQHGVTRERADEMIAAQNGLCAICGGPPTDRRWGRLHVDHCHETGKIREMLCGCCNTALGFMKDDPNRLQAAIEYLAKHS
jgi:hypothetical protein